MVVTSATSRLVQISVHRELWSPEWHRHHRIHPVRRCPAILGCGSGGAAVAAGILPPANAIDGGGSIRHYPVAGLLGEKPSQRGGWVPADQNPSSVICIYAVSRSVRDSAALLDASSAVAEPAQTTIAPRART